MDLTQRYLTKVIKDDALADYKMAFISGPRQVGKTTLARGLLTYPENEFNWDNLKFKREWNKDPIKSIEMRQSGPVLLDEIHKDRRWKSKLKGVYDALGNKTQLIITGSGKLDIYRKGSDSLLGRYLPYKLHPFSVAEHESSVNPNDIFGSAQVTHAWKDLLTLGGFPEPLLKGSHQKAKRWSRLRLDRLIFEDLRDFKGISNLHAFRILCEIIPSKVGSLLSMNSIKDDVGMAYGTVRSWVDVLDVLYFSFRIRPYSKKITRSLKAEPKIYLFDILQIPENEKARRQENLAALHLLKACDYWTDTAQGYFELTFVRDKEKREVDFLILRDKSPWMLIECKSNKDSISENLLYFNELLNPKYCIQLVSLECDRFHPALKVRVMDYQNFFSFLV